MDSIKQTILKYWFLASSLALVILYMLYDRRGRTIDQLHGDILAERLAAQLADIKQRSSLSQENYEKAAKDYSDLRNRHGDLLVKLGLGDAVVTPSDSSHN